MRKGTDMKILHAADLHIGKTVNGFPMLEDQRFILEQISGLAETLKADAIVLAGDVYDKPSPSGEAVSAFDSFLTSIADMGIPCFCVPGNHDSAERMAYASALLEHQGIFISPIYDGTIPHHALEDEFGACTFWMMPFLKPATVKAFHPELADEIGQDYTKAIEAAIGSCEIDTSSRNILIGHQFVTAGSAHPEQSDSELSLGGIDNVDASVFSPFDYVALGHIHRPQRIGSDTIRYAGSILKYSFSEIRYPKSVTLAELGAKGDVAIRAIPLHPLRDMREVKGPIDELVALATSGPEAHDYIHAILTDLHPPIDALSRLRSVYPNVMGIDFQKRTQAADAVESAALEPNRLNPYELFEAFFMQQNGSEPTPRQRELIMAALEKTVQPQTESEGSII